jgi:hypothetical protein
MTIWEIAISIGGGLVAGFINTLAGHGSTITLSILIELLGVPGNVANATNRVGILGLTATNVAIYERNGMIDWKRNWSSVLVCFAGAMLGMYLALISSSEQFVSVFKYLLVLMFVFLLINPRRWLRPGESNWNIPSWVHYTSLFLLGVYGGYIQMGIGLFLLALFVLGKKMTIMRANALKVLIVGLYTIVIFIVFWSKGWIHWQYGLILGAGQVVGGAITAQYFSRWRGADRFAYFTLILIVVFVLVKLFVGF